MEAALEEIYESRSTMFALNEIKAACKSLPKVLQPLGNILVEMRNKLVATYREFEEAFDGSKALGVFPKLRDCLRLLEELARDLDVKPPVVRQKFSADGMEQ